VDVPDLEFPEGMKTARKRLFAVHSGKAPLLSQKPGAR
jgi:hypothetical protein